MTEVLALIPARSGSKGIPHKNVKPFRGKPLLAHSIEQARNCRLITRTIVSTDSAEYAAIAKEYGAEAPFLRPPEFATDLATDLQVFQHALEWLGKNENYRPELCVHLRPTHPLREPSDLEKMIQILIESPQADSIRSVAPAPETPFKMWFLGDDGFLKAAVQTEIREAYNMPRQALPQAYLQNASIDVVRTRVIREMSSMTGKKILGYVMAGNHDIDLPADFAAAEQHAAGKSPA